MTTTYELSPFLEYGNIVDQMDTDSEIIEARLQVAAARSDLMQVEAELADLEADYQNKLADLRIKIEDEIIAAKKSKSAFGVKATYYKPRRSTSWKKVATALNPSIYLIDQHTSVSPARVKVTLE